MIRLDTPAGRVLKRFMDVVGAGLALIVSTPAFLLIAVAIRIETPGPVFFRQVRVGRGGREFRMWKFRSMARDAPTTGPSVTRSGDPRVTKVGRFLRRTKLDELPQFINVVRGEMSLVGPRPEVPEYVTLYSRRERAVLNARPGITDPASLAYLNEEELLSKVADPVGLYKETLMHDKLEMNLEYLRTATVLSDVRIVLRTFFVLFR